MNLTEFKKAIWNLNPNSIHDYCYANGLLDGISTSHTISEEVMIEAVEILKAYFKCNLKSSTISISEKPMSNLTLDLTGFEFPFYAINILVESDRLVYITIPTEKKGTPSIKEYDIID